MGGRVEARRGHHFGAQGRMARKYAEVPHQVKAQVRVATSATSAWVLAQVLGSSLEGAQEA
jgi:hypothetical protein